jgi:hypothetical protein
MADTVGAPQQWRPFDVRLVRRETRHQSAGTDLNHNELSVWDVPPRVDRATLAKQSSEVDRMSLFGAMTHPHPPRLPEGIRARPQRQSTEERQRPSFPAPHATCLVVGNPSKRFTRT